MPPNPHTPCIAGLRSCSVNRTRSSSRTGSRPVKYGFSRNGTSNIRFLVGHRRRLAAGGRGNGFDKCTHVCGRDHGRIFLPFVVLVTVAVVANSANDQIALAPIPTTRRRLRTLPFRSRESNVCRAGRRAGGDPSKVRSTRQWLQKKTRGFVPRRNASTGCESSFAASSRSEESVALLRRSLPVESLQGGRDVCFPGEFLRDRGQPPRAAPLSVSRALGGRGEQLISPSSVMSYWIIPFQLETTMSPRRTWVAGVRGLGTPPAIPTIKTNSTDGKCSRSSVARAAAMLFPISARHNATACSSPCREGILPRVYRRPAPKPGNDFSSTLSSNCVTDANSLGSAVTIPIVGRPHDCSRLARLPTPIS